MADDPNERQDAAPTTPPAEPDSTATGPDSLPDELTRWKQTSRRHEREAKTTRAELARLSAELEQVRSASQTEHERDVASAAKAARAEGEKTVRERYTRLVVASALTAAATGRLRSPDLVTRLVDPADFEVAEDGSLDTAAIAKAIDALVETHPELAVSASTGSFDQGARGGDSGPAGLSMNDLLRAAARGT